MEEINKSVERNREGYNEQASEPPTSPKSTDIDDIREPTIMDKTKFTISKLLNSDVQNWKLIIQQIDRLYEEYLEDPNEYEIGDTPGSVLNLMIQGMNNNQKNSDQNRNQDQSINKLDEIITLLKTNKSSPLEANTIRQPKNSITITPSKTDHQQSIIDTTGLYHGQPGQNFRSTTPFPQTPILSPIFNSYQTMGSQYIPTHQYLEPLLDSDKEIPILK